LTVCLLFEGSDFSGRGLRCCGIEGRKGLGQVQL